MHPNDAQNPSTESSDTLLRLEAEVNAGDLAALDRPLLAQWVKAQIVPMARLETASKFERCNIPLFPDNDQRIMMQALPTVVPFFNIVPPFCARARMRASDGDMTGARQDLVTALRLARLCQQTPLLITNLVGTAAEMRVCHTARQIAIHVPCTVWQLHALALDFSSVLPAASYAEIYDFGERFAALDMLVQLARGNTGPILRPELLIFDQTSPVDAGDIAQVDWNVLLRAANIDFDKSVTLFKCGDWRTIRRHLREEMDKNPRPKDIPIFPACGMFIHSPPEGSVENQRSQVIAFIHKRPNESNPAFTQRIKLLFDEPPGFGVHFLNLYITRALEYPLTQTTFALAIYRAEHHVYPDSLAALIPQYLPSIPQDPFADEGPLLYHTTPTGFILYSVGPNGKDDNGRKNASTSEDDIAVSSDPQKFDIAH